MATRRAAASASRRLMSTHIITGNSPHGIVRFPRALTAPWGVFALGALVAIVGIACLALVRGPHDLPLLLLYTASGFGFGMRIAQLSAIPADVFSGPHLGAILGVVQAGGGLGGAIGPFLGGRLFHITGSDWLGVLSASSARARS